MRWVGKCCTCRMVVDLLKSMKFIQLKNDGMDWVKQVLCNAKSLALGMEVARSGQTRAFSIRSAQSDLRRCLIVYVNHVIDFNPLNHGATFPQWLSV